MPGTVGADQEGGPGLAYPPNIVPALEAWMERVRITLEDLLAFALEAQAPAILGITVSIDDSGNVDVVVGGGGNLESVKVATSTSDFPSRSTVQGETATNTDDTFSAEFDNITTISEGDTVYVSALGYSETDGNGLEGELAKAKNQRPTDTQGSGVSISADASIDLSVPEGTLTLNIDDPQTLVDSVEYKEKEGAGDFEGTWQPGGGDAWDSKTGTAGSDTTLERIENIPVEEKHLNAIKYRVQWTDENSVSREELDTVPFDVDEIAEIHSLDVTRDTTDDTVIVSAGGDDDTTSIDVWVTIGGDPDTTQTPTATISGRSGTVDTGVTVQPGETAHVTVSGVDSDGNNGPEKDTRFSRETPDPRLVNAALDSVNDDNANSGDDIYNTSWEVNAAVDDTFELELILQRSTQSFPADPGSFSSDASVTETSPESTTSRSDSVNTADGSEDVHRVEFTLRDSNGNVVDSKLSSQTLSTV